MPWCLRYRADVRPSSPPEGNLVLRSEDGTALRLSISGYQFEGLTTPDDDRWDASWLLVQGDARTSTGTAWSFVHPCLTTWEANQLGRWLRAAAHGGLPDAPYGRGQNDWDDYGEVRTPGILHFTEPNLAFRLAGRDDTSVSVVVRFSHEALPPSPSGQRDLADMVSLALTVERNSLHAAADAWLAGLRRFPTRGTP